MRSSHGMLSDLVMTGSTGPWPLGLWGLKGLPFVKTKERERHFLRSSAWKLWQEDSVGKTRDDKLVMNTLWRLLQLFLCMAPLTASWILHLSISVPLVSCASKLGADRFGRTFTPRSCSRWFQTSQLSQAHSSTHPSVLHLETRLGLDRTLHQGRSHALFRLPWCTGQPVLWDSWMNWKRYWASVINIIPHIFVRGSCFDFVSRYSSSSPSSSSSSSSAASLSHSTLSHTIFHTRLCHTHTQLCHI